jgi:hypothetical protein
VEENKEGALLVGALSRIDPASILKHTPSMELQTKVVGSRRHAGDPVSCHRRAVRLMREADKLCPFPRPRGFVFKARTWAEWEAWKKVQANPRLW